MVFGTVSNALSSPHRPVWLCFVLSCRAAERRNGMGCVKRPGRVPDTARAGGVGCCLQVRALPLFFYPYSSLVSLASDSLRARETHACVSISKGNHLCALIYSFIDNSWPYTVNHLPPITNVDRWLQLDERRGTSRALRPDRSKAHPWLMTCSSNLCCVAPASSLSRSVLERYLGPV
jgi:hypothetical protein